MGRIKTFLLLVAVAAAGYYSYPVVKRELAARNCLANMRSMSFAANCWSVRNEGKAPANWLFLSGELITPKTLLCPADIGTTGVTDWTSFTPENSSYELVDAGGNWGDAKRVFFRCKVHGYICLGDGSVLREPPTQQGN